MKPIPLRWLIVVPFVVIALISGITMYFVSTVTMSNIANSVGMQYIKEVESRVYAHVSYFMTPLSTVVEINRHAFSSRTALLDDLTPLASRFYEQAMPYPQMTFISVATADGRYLASSRNPFQDEQHTIAANFVRQRMTMEGYYYDPIRYIGAKVETDPTFAYDPRIRPFYQDAVAAKEMVWSEVHPYYGSATLGVSLSGPIYDKQDQLIGVTAASVALVELDEYLESLRLVKNAYVFLAESDGALIATSREDQLYDTSGDATTRVRLGTHPDALLQLAGQQLQAGEHRLEFNQEQFLYHVRPIELAYGSTWFIGILIPNAHHKTVLTGYTQSTVIISLILFASIALVGSLIAQYIGKPIRKLNQAANDKHIEAIQQLPQSLSNIREVNSLSQALRLMADDLSDIMRNLEQKVAQRTSHLKDENESLLERSIRDELTGLYNRRGFNQAFASALEAARQGRYPVTFVLCDIDHFKRINDQFGHSAGDQALAEIANILKSNFRESQDIVARYGGEEFALVLMDTTLPQVLERLNKVRQELAVRAVVEGQHITLSFGVSCVEDLRSVSEQQLIDDTDTKLYQAKATGRNKVVS